MDIIGPKRGFSTYKYSHSPLISHYLSEKSDWSIYRGAQLMETIPQAGGTGDGLRHPSEKQFLRASVSNKYTLLPHVLSLHLIVLHNRVVTTQEHRMVGGAGCANASAPQRCRNTRFSYIVLSAKCQAPCEWGSCQRLEALPPNKTDKRPRYNSWEGC